MAVVRGGFEHFSMWFRVNGSAPHEPVARLAHVIPSESPLEIDGWGRKKKAGGGLDGALPVCRPQVRRRRIAVSRSVLGYVKQQRRFDRPTDRSDPIPPVPVREHFSCDSAPRHRARAAALRSACCPEARAAGLVSHPRFLPHLPAITRRRQEVCPPPGASRRRTLSGADAPELLSRSPPPSAPSPSFLRCMWVVLSFFF